MVWADARSVERMGRAEQTYNEALRLRELFYEARQASLDTLCPKLVATQNKLTTHNLPFMPASLCIGPRYFVFSNSPTAF